MKRDLDLYRQILLQLEAQPNSLNWKTIAVDGADPADVAGHVQLLREAGYIEGHDVTTMGSAYHTILPTRITHEGHDFLDTIRSATVWQKVKGKLATVGGGASLEVVKAMAESIVKASLGLG